MATAVFVCLTHTYDACRPTGPGARRDRQGGRRGAARGRPAAAADGPSQAPHAHQDGPASAEAAHDVHTTARQSEGKLFLLAHRIVHSYYLLLTGLLTERLMHVFSCCHVISVVMFKSCLAVLVKITHRSTTLKMLHDHISEASPGPEDLFCPDSWHTRCKRKFQHGICIDGKYSTASGMGHGEAAASSH